MELMRNAEQFINLCHTLNISKTAQNFVISKQAVSKNLSVLESELGCRLFLRTSKGLVLTDEGRMLLEYYNDVRRLTDELKEKVRDRSGQIKSIKIGFQNYMTVEDVLSEGFETDTLINIKPISPAALREELRTYTIDIGIATDTFVKERQGLKWKMIRPVPIMLLVACRHPAVKNNLPYEDIKHLPLVTDRMEKESEKDFEHRIRKEIIFLQIDPSHIIKTENRDSAFMAMKMGRGYLTVPEICVFTNRDAVKAYPTGKEDPLLCFFREKEEDEKVLEFVTRICHT